MMTCEQQLISLVKDISPTPTQRAGAARSHNYLRDILDSGNMADRILDSYLSGSYARNTVIYPLDDVDIVILIEPSHWTSFFDPSCDAVLRSFERAIRYRYNGSHLRIQRRSVRLRLYHLDIDVVPAIKGRNDTIRIPDREEDTWITSAPKRHAAIADGINQARNGKFKPLVKLLKSWNARLPSTASLKSFTIETISARLFEEEHFDTLEEGLLLYFDFLAHCKGEETEYEWDGEYGMSFSRFWGVKVPDTAGTGSNVAASVDWPRANRFLEHAARSRNKMIDAANAVRSDTAFRRVCEALKVN